MEINKYKILFIADLSSENNSLFRMRTIQDICNKVKTINIFEYVSKNKFIYWINYRFQPFLLIKKLNEKIIKEINKDNYHITWIEKGIFIHPKTLKKIKSKTILIHFNPDNCFGPREDGCWKTFIKCINLYDYNLLPRRINLREYRRIGSKKNYLFPFTYDKKQQFFEKLNKKYEITFIGSNHDNRAEFIIEVEKYLDKKINIFSDNWPKNMSHNKGIYGDKYRRVINESKVLINFITKDNIDEYSRRSFEIAACKACFVSEEGSVQEKYFRNNIETLYFENPKKCAEKINLLLNNENLISEISEKAFKRVIELKMENSYQIQRILKKIKVN